jgi:nucleoid DNA-binding protein
MTRAKWALAALVCILIGVGAQVAGPKKVPATFQDSIVEETKQKADAVEKMLKAFGPAVTQQLLAGRVVELPGVATIRVVRVKEYTDLVGGIVTKIPARNYVEIVPAGELDKVANLPGTVPARVVEPYEFKVMPDANPGIKTDGIKVPRTRIGR